MIYNITQYFFWPYSQEQFIKEKFDFSVPKSWVNPFGKIDFWDFETVKKLSNRYRNEVVEQQLGDNPWSSLPGSLGWREAT